MGSDGNEGMPKVEPQREHAWLRRLAGDWTWELEAPAGGPGQQPEKLSGIEHGRLLGDLWVILEGEGPMPGGGEARTVMTLGFDPQRGRFVGSWIGSMMTWHWVYEGTLDAEQRVLTLESEGPEMSGAGGTARYRDVIEMLSDDHRTLTGNVLGADGTWQPMMVAHYRRR